MAEQPVAPQPRSDQSAQMFQASIQLISMRSSVAKVFDEEAGEWRITSRDEPVTEKFNRWADEHDMNPVGPPVVTLSQFRHSPIQHVETSVLCVSVMSRASHAMMMLAQQEQLMKVAAGLRSTAADAPVPVETTSPEGLGETAPTAADVKKVDFPAPPPPS